MKSSYPILIRALYSGLLIVFAGFSFLFVACNTMEGVGTDIKMTGKALEESAERNKKPSKPAPVPACYPNCPKHL